MDSFTSTDQGLRPVELHSEHFHIKCAEAIGLIEDIKAWHGGQVRFADYAMDWNPELTEHEFCCAGCYELFPQIVADGQWIG